jgi:hypothetical protein
LKALFTTLFLIVACLANVSAQTPYSNEYTCTYNGKTKLSPDILCDTCRLIVHNKKGQTFSVVRYTIALTRYGKSCIYPCFGNRIPKDKMLLITEGGGVTMIAFTGVVIIDKGKEVEISGPDPYMTKAQ